MRLLITRPPEDAEALAAALADRGIETMTAPMMEIVDVSGPAPDPAGIRALLITSANGIRAFARRHPDRETPVFAVGDASAAAARELGFAEVNGAGGDVETLVALVMAELDPAEGALLHVAGSHVAGDLQGALARAGFEVRRHVLYEAKAVENLSAEATDALASGALSGVLLFSPRTAAIFRDRLAAAGLEDACAGLAAYCLSPAVADKVRNLGWRQVAVAPEPSQDALLALIEA